MDRCAETERNINEKPFFNKEAIKEDINIKVKELLKFQHNMIVKLDEVIKKLEDLNL